MSDSCSGVDGPQKTPRRPQPNVTYVSFNEALSHIWKFPPKEDIPAIVNHLSITRVFTLNHILLPTTSNVMTPTLTLRGSRILLFYVTFDTFSPHL